jgi:hypothetical protein
VAHIDRCNFRDYKYIILQCSDEAEYCGGLGDRLKSLPFFIAAAAYNKRIFLIRWQRPTKLEEFLIPNEIHWSVPDWMYEELNDFHNRTESIFASTSRGITRFLKDDKLVIEGRLQDFFGGSGYYNWMDSELDKNKELIELSGLSTPVGWKQYQILFHDLFFTLFKPIPPIAKLVEDKMQLANLVPGNFTASHYRAFYGTENKKHVVTEEILDQKTRNALNCASFIQPGDPIYFASDSLGAISFAREMMNENNATNTINRKKIVVFDEAKEALHIDKSNQWTSGNVSDFYPTFVDLLIMSKAKCMALGMGGYSLFANFLSTNSHCVIQHDHQCKKKHKLAIGQIDMDGSAI